nr:MAG TPA: hypothetical protein [Caudoviricetes sp.]
MNRISLSDRDRFVPKEGEVFFCRSSGKGNRPEGRGVIIERR